MASSITTASSSEPARSATVSCPAYTQALTSAPHHTNPSCTFLQCFHKFVKLFWLSVRKGLFILFVLLVLYPVYTSRRCVQLNSSILARPARGKNHSQFQFFIMQAALGLFSCLPISAMCEETSGSALIFQPPRLVSAQQPQTTVWRALLLFSVSVKNRLSYFVAMLAPSPLRLAWVFGLLMLGQG